MRKPGPHRSHRGRSLFAAFGTALALAATLLGAAPIPSPASADERPSLRALLDECNTGPGISGVATAADGTPIADAPVTVFAEHDGPGKATLPVLARDRTDAAGCYQLEVPANRQLLEAADRFGLVNMHLIIQNGRQLQSVNVARDILVSAGGRVQLLEVGTQAGTAAYRPGRATLGLPTTGSAHQSFGPQAAAARADATRGQGSLRLGGHAGVDPDAVAATERAVGAAPDQVTLPASITSEVRAMHKKFVKSYKKHPVLIGQWFSKIRGVRQEWRYTEGASSEMASAHSTDLGGGGYERSSKYSRSTNATVTFPIARGRVGKLYRTYFRYAKYMYVYCDTVGCAPTAYRVQPYKWERGTQVISRLPQPHVQHKNCTNYFKGSKDYSRGSKAIEWTDGVLVKGDLFKVIGGSVSLSSQTGFTSNAENFVHFTRRGKLCGWAAPLSGSPRILAARPW